MRARRVACFPAATRVHAYLFPPLLARLGPLAGADKAILSICGSASLAPAFLAVMIFTVISGRYPRPDIRLTVLYLRAAVYCGGHGTISRDPLFLADPMTLGARHAVFATCHPPLQPNPATVVAVKSDRLPPLIGSHLSLWMLPMKSRDECAAWLIMPAVSSRSGWHR